MERISKRLLPRTPDALAKINIPVVRIEWNGYYYYAWCDDCGNNSVNDIPGKTLAVSEGKSHAEFAIVMYAARIHQFHEPGHRVTVYDVTETS